MGDIALSSWKQLATALWEQLVALAPFIFQIPQMIWNLKYTRIIITVYSTILIFFAIANRSDKNHNYKITQILKHFSLTPFYIVALAHELYIFAKKVKRFFKRWLIYLLRYYLNQIQKFINRLFNIFQTVYQSLEWIGHMILDFVIRIVCMVFDFVVRIGQNLEWICQQIWSRLEVVVGQILFRLTWVWSSFEWIINKVINILNFIYEKIILAIKKLSAAYNYVSEQIANFLNYLFAIALHVYNSILTFSNFICKVVWSCVKWLTKPIRVIVNVIVLHFKMLYEYIKWTGRQILRNLIWWIEELFDLLMAIWKLIMDCLRWTYRQFRTCWNKSVRLIFVKFWRVYSWLANKCRCLCGHIYCCLRWLDNQFMMFFVRIWIILDWILWQFETFCSFVCRWVLYCRRKIRLIIWSVALIFWKWLIRPCWLLIKAAYSFMRNYYQFLRLLIGRYYEIFLNIYRCLTAPIRQVYANVKIWIVKRRRLGAILLKSFLLGLKTTIRQTYNSLKKGISWRRQAVLRMMSEIRGNVKTVIKETYMSAKAVILYRFGRKIPVPISVKVSGN